MQKAPSRDSADTIPVCRRENRPSPCRRGAVKSTTKDAGRRRWGPANSRTGRSDASVANERSRGAGQRAGSAIAPGTLPVAVGKSAKQKKRPNGRARPYAVETQGAATATELTTLSPERRTMSVLERLQALPIRFLRFTAVRDRTGLSRTTIWRLERQGVFPKHRRISPNVVGWLEQEVNEWVLGRAQVG